jgi:hypothetical protein
MEYMCKIIFQLLQGKEISYNGSKAHGHGFENNEDIYAEQMYLETDILPKMYNAYKSLLIYTVKK